jgi:hypothetical protein
MSFSNGRNFSPLLRLIGSGLKSESLLIADCANRRPAISRLLEPISSGDQSLHTSQDSSFAESISGSTLPNLNLYGDWPQGGVKSRENASD